MKFNDREVARMSEEKAELEGRLNYRKANCNNQYYYQSVFKERWFKLIDNFLFYHRINDVGKVEKQAMGVFVLETAKVSVENVPESPFAFSVTFQYEPDRKHIFSCMSDSTVSLWVGKLGSASYEHLTSKLYSLQSKIFSTTGKDPLLMVRRNPGSMNWAPGQPSPRPEPDIHRSESSTDVSQCKQSTFFDRSWPGHHRAAPSPPPRKKNSPSVLRDRLRNGEKSELFFDNDHFLHVHNSTTHPPVPPMRRNSPKRQQNTDTAADALQLDLIQF